MTSGRTETETRSITASLTASSQLRACLLHGAVTAVRSYLLAERKHANAQNVVYHATPIAPISFQTSVVCPWKWQDSSSETSELSIPTNRVSDPSDKSVRCRLLVLVDLDLLHRAVYLLQRSLLVRLLWEHSRMMLSECRSIREWQIISNSSNHPLECLSLSNFSSSRRSLPVCSNLSQTISSSSRRRCLPNLRDLSLPVQDNNKLLPLAYLINTHFPHPLSSRCQDMEDKARMLVYRLELRLRKCRHRATSIINFGLNRFSRTSDLTLPLK